MPNARLSTLRLLLLVVALLVSGSVNAGLFGFGGDSWKEEVLQHDGQKIIVERSQTYGGRHEIGQSSPVKEHTIRFISAKSGHAITWTSEYGKDIGRTYFNALALHMLNGTPYLVVEPNLCLSYNKWGRPNPPYVIFKHDGQTWQRIEMADLPTAFERINLIVNNGRVEHIKKANQEGGFITAQDVAGFNRSLTQPQYKSILREPIEGGTGITSCEVVVHYKCGWGAPGEFNRQYFDSICKERVRNFV